MRAAAAALTALAVLCGCSDDETGGSSTSAPPAPPRTSSIPLGPAPEGVTQLCGIVALQKEQVLCPTRFPARPGSQAVDGRPLAPDDDPRYLIEWRVTGFQDSRVRVGGRPAPYSLDGRAGVVRRVTIGRARGVVVRSRGDVVVLWNAGGRGYMTSLQFDGHPLRDRIDAAVGMARSSAPPTPGEGCDPGTDCG